MRYLVLGGAGYVGSHFAWRAHEEGHSCLIYDNLCTGHRTSLPHGATLVVADLMDENVLWQVLSDYQPDAIFHFAAFSLVGESVKEPSAYYRNNVEGVRLLLDAMRLHRPHVPLIFSSTCAVFGIPDKLPIAEDDPKKPISPYGRSKLMAEYLMEDYAKAYGLRCMALRYFNASGAHPSAQIGEDHQPETHLIPNILKAVAEGKPLQVFGSNFDTKDGTCVRDYIHVGDLAAAHLQAALYLQEQPAGTFDAIHLGTGQGYSILDIIAAVEEVLQKKVTYTWADPREGDPPSLYTAKEKARRILGFEAQHSDLKTIVRTAWEWHSKNPNGFDDRP